MSERGFTLVELMLAVAILGVLLSILLPVYGDVLARARDAQTIGNLAILRMSLAAYYADNLTYPSFAPPYAEPTGYGDILQNALVPTYIDKIPAAMLDGNYHPVSNRVFDVWNMTGLHEDGVTDTGEGWRYDANPFDAYASSAPLSFGSITVLCYHTNAQGRNWQSY